MVTEMHLTLLLEIAHGCACTCVSSGFTITKEHGAYFNRTAWAAYSSLSDALTDVFLEVEVKLRTLHSGVFFYNAQSDTGNGDFISLALKDGRVELQFDSGSGMNA